MNQSARVRTLVSVQSHAQTLQILHSLKLEDRIRLVTSTFLALPAIVRTTDMAVLMPKAIAETFEPAGQFKVIDARLPADDFTVALHWSRRHEHTPMLRWGREAIVSLFKSPPKRR